jgi:antitoxin VapB
MVEKKRFLPAGSAMGLNIKSEEARQLAAHLAELTGETITKAVTIALRERLDRIQRQRNVSEIMARAQEIIRRSGGAEPYQDHAELLYDEQGLPK